MITSLYQLIEHIRYPISHPADVLRALGIQPRKSFNFRQFLQHVVTQSPRTLYRRMLRTDAEKIFKTAYKKEVFHHTTIISYCFCQGWLEFILEFDTKDLLRRLYVQHRLLNSAHSLELELPEWEESSLVAPLKEEKISYSLRQRFLQKLTFIRRSIS